MLRFGAVAAVAALVGLTGCVTPGEQMAQNSCVGMGYRPGTELFLQCMAMKQQERMQRSAIMAQAGAQLMAPPPRNPSVTCMTTGTMTTCH